MYVLKGFITNALFENNTPGTVAAIGEISTQSQTFAREKGLYRSAVSADLALTTFISATNAVPTPVTVEVSDQVITVAKSIFDRIRAVQGPVFADELLAGLLTMFSQEAEQFEMGEIINDGQYYCPEWISWKNKSIPNLQPDNNIKIWFSDASFQSQYDEYEIVVVPPTDRLDDFFKTGAEVGRFLAAITPSENMNRIQAAKQGYPESIIRAESYDYIDPYNHAHRVSSTWHILIYGAAGNNIDSITDAVIAYALTHSTHGRDDWLQILPDLFRRTEFSVLPLWDQYAIPNRTLEAGIYSPVTNLQRASALIKRVVINYPAPHIDANLCLLSNSYKSLSVLAVGSPDNRDALFALPMVFPDYIDVASTSTDFNRMSQTTQNWANMLAEMLIAAETMGKFTTVPQGMTKITRNNILYLVKRFGNINYLVVAKSNFPLPSTQAGT